MGASFAKMEAPLGAGGADDGSSLLPPAARAGMTVRIKRKERENWISLIISSALKSSATFFVFIRVSRFLRRFSVPLLFALSSEEGI